MTRGGPVKRTHRVSTRLTPEERAAWERRREASGRRELGAWIRAVVSDAEGLSLETGQVPGELPVVPELNVAAYRQLAGAASNLNQLARRANAGADVGPEIGEVLEELRCAARAVTGRVG